MLHPQAEEMVLMPVAPHLGLDTALVLPSTTQVELTVESDHEAMLSIDGYLDMALSLGDAIQVQRSPYKALFLRAHPPEHFYATLTRRVGFEGGRGVGRAVSD